MEINSRMGQLPLNRVLKNGACVELDVMHSDQQEAVRELLNLVIAEGQTYPHNQPLTAAEFQAYWMSHHAFVVRSPSDPSGGATGKILGAFYLKPNFPGHCSHICNAGFIVSPESRGQGIGRWMGEAMLHIAASLGFEAVQFNLVFATNTPSLNLWRSLGFTTLGRIPAAVHLPDGSTVDALILYRSLQGG